jgi:pilus assembly protein TadC
MEKNVTLGVRLPGDLADVFRRICDEDDRPVSEELRRLIRARVAQDDEGRPAQAAPVQASVEQDRRDAA